MFNLHEHWTSRNYIFFQMPMPSNFLDSLNINIHGHHKTLPKRNSLQANGMLHYYSQFSSHSASKPKCNVSSKGLVKRVWILRSLAFQSSLGHTCICPDLLAFILKIYVPCSFYEFLFHDQTFMLWTLLKYKHSLKEPHLTHQFAVLT